MILSRSVNSMEVAYHSDGSHFGPELLFPHFDALSNFIQLANHTMRASVCLTTEKQDLVSETVGTRLLGVRFGVESGRLLVELTSVHQRATRGGLWSDPNCNHSLYLFPSSCCGIDKTCLGIVTHSMVLNEVERFIDSSLLGRQLKHRCLHSRMVRLDSQ